MKLFKNTLKSLTAVAAVVALSSSMVAFSASATYKGDLTFIHGQDTENQFTYGEVKSTEIETSMAVYGKAHYLSGKDAGSIVPYGPNGGKNRISARLDIPHGPTKGSSFFEYHVDDEQVHSSTEWWNFDFT